MHYLTVIAIDVPQIEENEAENLKVKTLIKALKEDKPQEVIPLNVETHIGKEYTTESNIIIELHKKINGTKFTSNQSPKLTT